MATPEKEKGYVLPYHVGQMSITQWCFYKPANPLILK